MPEFDGIGEIRKYGKSFCHFVPRGGSNSKLDAKIPCKTWRWIFWWPTWPRCAKMKSCLSFCPGVWTWCSDTTTCSLFYMDSAMPGQTVIKFRSSSPGRFERYATCHTLPIVAKMGTLWAVIRHWVHSGHSNFKSKARFMCRIVRGFLWYPSWPYWMDGPENPVIMQHKSRFLT